MRLELTGRHVDITPALRRLLDTKLSKLERVLNHRALSAQVVLTREKHRHRADITLHARGEKFLHGVGRRRPTGRRRSRQAIGKLTQQAQRVKGKWERRKRDGDIKRDAPAEAAYATTGTPRRRAARADAADCPGVTAAAQTDVGRRCRPRNRRRRRRRRRLPGPPDVGGQRAATGAATESSRSLETEA